MTKRYVGEIFQEIRKNRGLTITEAAGKAVDRSFISKFENGQTDISLTKLIQILHNIGLTLSEFSEEITQNENNLEMFLTRVGTLFHSRNFESLKEMQLSQKIHWQQTHNKIYKVNFILISSLININQNPSVSPANVQYIVNYLFDVGEWRCYEYQLFSRVIHILPINIIDYYLSIIVTKYNDLDKAIQVAIIKSLENRIVLAIDNNDLKFGNHWYQVLLKFDIPDGEAYLTIKRKLLLGMLYIMDSRERSRGIHVVQQQIALLREIVFVRMAAYHQDQLDQFIQVHHKK